MKNIAIKSSVDVVESQKQLADEILLKISMYDPYVIVAGGAPRDWWMGRQAADIDVFINVNRTHSMHVVESVFEKMGFELENAKHGEIAEDYKLNPYIKWVYNVKGLSHPVQLVFLNCSTFRVLQEFPLNISRIWYRYDRGVCTTPEFVQAMDTKSIIKLSELYADGNKYIRKIREKFPEFQYYNSLHTYTFHRKEYIFGENK